MAAATTQDILWLMKQAFTHQRKKGEEAMRSYGITATLVGTLTQIQSSPGLSSSDMARRLSITPPAVIAAIGPLEESDLLERFDDPNMAESGSVASLTKVSWSPRHARSQRVKPREDLLAAFDHKQRRAFAELHTSKNDRRRALREELHVVPEYVHRESLSEGVLT